MLLQFQHPAYLLYKDLSFDYRKQPSQAHQSWLVPIQNVNFGIDQFFDQMLVVLERIAPSHQSNHESHPKQLLQSRYVHVVILALNKQSLALLDQVTDWQVLSHYQKTTLMCLVNVNRFYRDLYLS